MKVPFWAPARDFKKRESVYIEAFLKCGRNGDWILRGALKEFESKFADLVGTKFAVGVASGTDALILSLKAIGLEDGDEVIVPSYTFRATIEAVHHAGGVPVLVDLGDNWREHITKNTKAVIPAHIAGEVMNWTIGPGDKHIVMIEDSCQAITAKSLTGIAAAYSFYPAKILGCFGDGGAIATNDQELYEKLMKMRNHSKGDWRDFGYNSRLDNLQAAFLLEKLEYLPTDIKRRKDLAQRYDEGLKELASFIDTPKERAIYQDYIIDCGTPHLRDNLYDFLAMKGVETMKNGYDFPEETPKMGLAKAYEARTLRLPCNPDVASEEADYVIKRIKQFYTR